jgi:hypothetical protein
MDYEKLQVHPQCLMVFVDETGHEEFADPNYPVFGFGGCVIPAFAASEVLEQPWREMKERHFGGADLALHASNLRSPTSEQLAALYSFFRGSKFGRFAVTMCRDVSLPEGKSSIEVMSGALRNTWSELASRDVPTPVEIAFLFEASERGSPLIEKYFGPTIVHVGAQRIPAHNGFVEKRFGLEALEVADFVAHAAGGQAHSYHRGKSGFRKDFEVVFCTNDLWSSWFHLGSAPFEPEEPGTGSG